MTAQQPGSEFPTDPAGKHSWSILYEHGFDYITQRPTTTTTTTASTTAATSTTAGGEILIGGGLFQSGKQGMDMFGVYDDSATDTLTLMHLGGVLPSVFRWGDEAPGRRVLKAWSGVVGFTGDVLPLVGRLDARLTKREVQVQGKAQAQGREEGSESSTKTKTKTKTSRDVAPGEWIAAYFCGDGMVWAWLSGTALGVMLAGSEDEDLPAAPGRPAGVLKDWFPDELAASWERLQGMDIADLADEL
ncbi:hypothetical protein BD289DRAFT_447119 [Coniella lustricola]|uniref:Uncharacterized protein n=1 Tax=Coniella lustricola TaxID=2025994 RepID=A0A2T2ZTF1_9PEZI|nr:hypothetical protein BD289DRAFT_447119 [Coniella lustricola]